MYNLEVINQIKDVLIRRGETLALAESVTSGHIQAAVSLATKATEFFQGGVTTYNIQQKTRILKIDATHAKTCNCVSEKVAGEMAIGTSKLFHSDWAIAITGYAAPVPELDIDQLFSYWAISHQGVVTKTGMIREETDDPLKVQIRYTGHVLSGFLDFIKSAKQ